MPLNHVPLVLLLLAVGACHSVQNVRPAEYIPAHRPAIVWVTYNDNSFVPVVQPHIVGDTLKGMWQGLQEPISIPLNQIQTVQANLPDYERAIILFSTLGAILGGTLHASRQ